MFKMIPIKFNKKDKNCTFVLKKPEKEYCNIIYPRISFIDVDYNLNYRYKGVKLKNIFSPWPNPGSGTHCWYTHHRHFGESGAQYRPGNFRRRRDTLPALVVHCCPFGGCSYRGYCLERDHG